MILVCSLYYCNNVKVYCDVYVLSFLALEVEVPKAACTQLLKFLLDSLPHCGQSYLGVFKAIVDFSQGNTFLPITDKVFLLEQLKSSNLESEVACLKGIDHTAKSIYALSNYYFLLSSVSLSNYTVFNCTL